MKKIVTLLVFVIAMYFAKAQIGTEVQLGGSHFLGTSMNIFYSFPVSDNHSQKIIPSFGMGVSFFNKANLLLNAGLDYKIKKAGIGVEVSRFKTILINTDQFDHVAYMLFPNLNYEFRIKSKYFIQPSLGIWFPFETPIGFNQLHYAGNCLPGIGINIGYIFEN
jgi:hypothetical protein